MTFREGLRGPTIVPTGGNAAGWTPIPTGGRQDDEQAQEGFDPSRRPARTRPGRSNRKPSHDYGVRLRGDGSLSPSSLS